MSGAVPTHEILEIRGSRAARLGPGGRILVDGDEWEYAGSSTTNLTVSDALGVGRTMDNWIPLIGRPLAGLISSYAERFGRGPNATFARMLSISEDQRRNLDCWLGGIVPDRRIRQHTFPRRPPSLQIWLNDISKSNGLMSRFFCPWCRYRYADFLTSRVGFRAGSQELLEMMVNRESRPSTRCIAAYYVTLLVVLHPSIRSVLLELHVNAALLHLLQESLEFNRNGDYEELLSPIRRVLMQLSDTSFLNALNELEAIERRLLHRDWGKMVKIGGPDHPDHNSVENLGRGLSVLLRATENPESGLLALPCLTFVLNGTFIWEEVFTSYMSQEIDMSRAVECWLRISAGLCMYPLERAFYNRLVDTVYQRMQFGTAFESWTNLWIPLLRVLAEIPSPSDTVLSIVILSFVKRVSKGLYWEPFDTVLDDTNHIKNVVRDLYRTMVNRDHSSETRCISFHWESRDVLDIVETLLSPFLRLWVNFGKNWQLCRSPSPGFFVQRVIEPTQLGLWCDELVELLRRSECSVDDVYQIGCRDPDCCKEILRRLSAPATSQDPEAHARCGSVRQLLQDVYPSFGMGSWDSDTEVPTITDFILGERTKLGSDCLWGLRCVDTRTPQQDHFFLIHDEAYWRYARQLSGGGFPPLELPGRSLVAS